MARGWESKSVESQLEEAEKAKVPSGKRVLTPEEADRARQCEVLTLARTRIGQQIETASNERFREMLRQELKAVEEKLAALKLAS